MNISLADLIPLYPSQDDPEFQAIISSKKEFNELSTGPKEILVPGEKFKHQTLIERFMLVMDRGFLFHRTGTGKTCSIIGAAEYYRSIAEGLRTTFRTLHKIETPVKAGHAFIIVKSSLRDEFEKQFFCVCTNKKYVTHELESTKLGNQRTAYINRELKKWYTIDSYDKFTKKVRNLTDDEIVRNYSDSIFFVDEIQTIASQLNPTYNVLYRLFHTIKRSKVFVASATPMVNSTEPIVYIMNLILPMYRQIPLKDDIDTIPDEKLLTYFSGMVSYVRELDTGVDIKYIGSPIDVSEEFEKENFKPQMIVKKLIMEKFQTDGYKRANEIMEEDQEAFSLNLMSASNFIFPDGLFGGTLDKVEGYKDVSKRYVAQGIAKYVSSPKLNVYIPTHEFKQYLSSLSNIRRSSVKMGYIIDELVKYPNKKAFIYDKFVNGSGLIAKILCLECVRTAELPMGFSRYIGDTPAFVSNTASGQKSICIDKSGNGKIRVNPKRRYAILTGNNLNNRENILELFNSYENRYGDYIQVLLGSKVLQEGVNLSDVTQVFVNPDYHESGTYQAISRAIRATSHVNLIEDIANEKGIPIDKVRIDVNVHKLAAVPDNDELDSIDLNLFLTSEYKDRKIKQKERLLMRSANDCNIYYNRNIRPTDKNGSSQCAYTECKYECISEKKEDDFSTFDILYMDDLINRLTGTLIHIFQLLPIIVIDRLYTYYKDIHPKYINRAIEQMVYSKTKLINRYGYDVFLQTQGNIVFLQYDYPTSDIHYPISEYPKMISVTEENTLDEFINNNHTNNEKTEIELSDNDFKTNVLKLNSNTIALVVENAIYETKVLGKESELNSKLISIFSPYLYSTYEPLKDIRRSKEELRVKDKGKGRKPKLELMKQYKYKDKMYPVDKSNEKVYFHILLEIKQSTTGYGKSNIITKPSELIHILKPSENIGWRKANPYELPVYNAVKDDKYNENMKNMFDNELIYGIIGADDVFRIVDKTKESENTKDKRTETKGRECSTSSFYIEDMYRLLARFNIRPPDMVKTSLSKMEPVVRKKMKEITDTLTSTEIEIIYGWLKSTYKRDKICEIIEKYLEDHNLLIRIEQLRFMD